MRDASRVWTWCRGKGAIPALVALLLAPSTAMAVAPQKQADGSRNFDARIDYNKRFRAVPAVTQLRSAAELKRDTPDLGVTFDEATGATRSVVNYVGALTGPQAGREPAAVGLDFVRANLGLLGLSEADLAGMETTDTVYSAVSGATYVYLRQRHEGLPLYNGQLHFGVDRNGRVMIVNNLFLPGLASAVNATRPSLSAEEAVTAAAASLGIDAGAPVARGEGAGADQSVVLDAPGISSEPVSARLMLLPIRQGEARLVWNFQVHTLDNQHVYDMNVDAVDARVWTRFDWVAADSYTVYNRPVESPNHAVPPAPADSRTVVINPATVQASPFGWHDTNAVAGPEFTITRGNNVEAYPDRVAPDGTGGDPTGPDGGAGLVFVSPLNLTQPPSTYVPAAVTNLFFWNNIIHDIQYNYGFDTAGGNFQVNQYGGGGLGNDDVRAEAQDFSGTNNANFFTPPDGQRPRMQMYIGTGPTPDVDGDFDNGVIVHEYGHGISNRLVGGPANVGCLSNNQQPGEGLSDWWAMTYTAEVGDAGPDARGMGTYLFGQPANGPGIRPHPYSTDNSVNPDTYASVAGRAVPHGVGAVWAQGYWEVYWRLVTDYGFDINLYNATGGAGNQRANLYINEGLKATICSPAFTDVRDGVVAAAATLHGGADVCKLWESFAAYGLGTDAISGGPNGLNPTNGFQLPHACRQPGPVNLTATPTANNQITLNWSPLAGATSYRVYRATGSCPQSNYTQIATGVMATTYVDNSVSGGLTYAYVVTAVDGNGIETTFSNCDDALATGVCFAPPAFSGLGSVTSAGTAGCAINLDWDPATPTCPGTTVSYNVYRSTSAGFTPSAATLRQSCLTTVGFVDDQVNSGTRYHYVVRAEDSQTNGSGPCNLGNEDTNLVRGSAVPAGASSTVTDDVENGGGLWSTTGGNGSNSWAIVTTQANSPTHSWFIANPATVSDRRLAAITPGNIPPGFVMSFFHRFDTEADFDGHVVEYSLDGGATWTDILGAQGNIPANPARFLQNGYNSIITPGRPGWSGANGAFQQVQVDMADFAGRDLQIRFRFLSDGGVGGVGVWIDDITIRLSAAACNSAESVAPAALAIDTAGNLVFQPNELVTMVPTWRNTGVTTLAVTGQLTAHQGPAGAVYSIPDASASYGTIAAGDSATCSNCYTVSNSTAGRPLTHWDSTVLETVAPTGATKTWTLHIGDSFTDVPDTNGFYRFIETMLHNNVTVGCTADAYCPTASTTREAMAAFVLVAKDPTAVPPPNCVAGSETFNDVPASSPFCRWIEELFRRGVVTGCAPDLYCPTAPATREQMAVFVLRTLDGTIDPPACVAGSERFDDVPASSGFCRWIEELANRGVVTGCTATSYCPAADVTREQMSVFLGVTFSLSLYGL